MGVACSGLCVPGCVVLFNTSLHISNETPSLKFIDSSQAPVIDIFFKECEIRNALPKNCGTLMSAQGGG